jgi:hypothetical protein
MLQPLPLLYDNSASMLAAEPDWQTDEPDKIALYRTQLGEDLSNPHRIRYCKTLVDISYKEISGREGLTVAMPRLSRGWRPPLR